MSDTLTDRDRLRAPGRAVVLADGRELPIRFGLDELCRLEGEYGSLVAFTEAINATKEGGNALFLTTLRKVLAIGLERHGVTYADLDSLFVIEQRWQYRGAIIDAYNEAMPPAEPEGKASADPSTSRGPTSTTPEPFGSAVPTTTSGE
jgi:hypothetical protein